MCFGSSSAQATNQAQSQAQTGTANTAQTGTQAASQTGTSSGTQTGTTAPSNPAVQGYYAQLGQQANTLANQPLQLYNGQLVAPLNANQNTAISDIAGAQGQANPYLIEAAQYAQQGATPITSTPYNAAAVNQYMSPYTSDVVNTTEAQLNNQNAIQQGQLAGSAISAGAFGGDRSGVAQAVLGGQQQLSEAPTIAGLENAGYTNAQGEFNTQNQAQMTAQQGTNAANQAASYALGTIGPTLENTTLAGASALSGAGAQQQNVAQENLNVPYEQYLQQQAYPYQSEEFESGILPSVAQGTGITATGANAGTSGSTSFGSTTGNTLGSTTGTSYGTGTGTTQASTSPTLFGIPIRTGGRVRHLASGGLPYTADDSINTSSDAVPDPSVGFIPSGSAGGTGTGGIGYSAGPNMSGGGAGMTLGTSMPSVSYGGVSASTMPMPSMNLTGSISGNQSGSGQGQNGSNSNSNNGFSGLNQIGNDYNTLSNAYTSLFGTPSTLSGADAGMEGVDDMGADIGGETASGGGGLLSTATDALSSMGSDALAFIAALHRGGRARLDNGGNSSSSDQPLVINPMDPGELHRGGNVRRHLDDGGLPDAQRGDWFPGQSAVEAAFAPRYQYMSQEDRGPAPPAPTLSNPQAPQATAPKFDITPDKQPAGASAMTMSDTPPAWRNKATNYGVDPTQVDSDLNANTQTLASHAPSVLPQQQLQQPTWDNGEPVSKGLDQAWQPGAAGREVIPAYSPSIGPALLRGLGGLFSEHPIQGAINGAMDEYEKDANPTLDHSGSEILARYANGPTIGTGIPTDSALSARAMYDYRTANTNMNQMTREDRIKEEANAADQRNQAQAAATAERAAAAAAADADRKQQLKIAQMNADAGRWTYAGVDPGTNRPILLDARSGQTKYGDSPIAAKPTAPKQATPMAQSVALQNAQRDYDRFFPAPKPDPSNPGAALQPRQVPPEGMLAWLQKRAQGYMSGNQAQPAAAGPSATPATPATANAPAPIPSRPPSVPAGSQYSPSRRMWRDAQGSLYNQSGQRQ